MTTIFKYPAPIIGDGRLTIELPRGARVLDVQMQMGEPFIWAQVNPAAPKQNRSFRWYAADHGVDDSDRRYIGTIQLVGGYFVFHLFEILS